MTSTRTKSYLRSLAALVALVAAIAALLLLAYDADPAHAAGRCSVTPSTTTCTFDTGTSTWTVPDGVTEATFDLFGAQGGGVRSDPGGLGGEATATIPVTPGEPLQVNVGGQGGTPNCCDGGAGGYNGGGAGGQGPCCSRQGGAGGGGASDVRRDTNALGGFALDERIVVAGGGGGIGGSTCCGYGAGGAGGTGGGASGTEGCCSNATDRYNVGGGGGGGSDVAGGSGGTGTYGLPDAGPGVLGIGGTGGGASTNNNGGGGGGGGYYGGGGGGGGKYTGGGGGGSGFGPDDVVFKSGVREGNGLVTITYATPPDTTAPTLSVSHTPDSTNGWNKTSPVTLNVSASDSGSGLAGAPTCTDGTTSLTLTAGSTAGTWTAPVSGDGTHNISCSVSDIFDNSSGPKTDTVKIDATAPSTSCSVTPTRLNPAANNHKLINITASVSVADTTGGSGANGFTLVSVTSNQADSGLARDDVAGDIQGWALGTEDKSGQVRAERYGGTRTYTLTYRGYDVAGNAKDCSATVTVPKGK